VIWAEAHLGAALDERKRAVLREQEIDGKALLLVSREELARFGLPLGFAAKLKDGATAAQQMNTETRHIQQERPHSAGPKRARVAVFVPDATSSSAPT